MSPAHYMSGNEIEAHQPGSPPPPGTSSLDRARRAMDDAGHGGANQQMGARWPIGCVALEITQRCNLDCTLCYLSESSESVRDIPLEEVFRRIELIYRHYGRNTDVQITGGEPTLRKRDELLEIVRRVRDRGMRATLMTNGIKTNRQLFELLAECGLNDVAFHVDTTQQRKGYRNEFGLNAVRRQYIDSVAGLPISVMFNTTVHDGNFRDIPGVVRFFRSKAGRVRTASFQLQAETGRGIQGKRSSGITPDSVGRQIERGAGTTINFAASLIGHPKCNRYGLCLEANGALYDAFDDTPFIGRIQSATAALTLHHNDSKASIQDFARWMVRHPKHAGPVLGWALRKVWQMKRNLIAAKGRVNTLSFVIHNFMDARALEHGRINACVFMVMTRDGPVSMCMHNAKRDRYILQPIQFFSSGGHGHWQPLDGPLTGAGHATAAVRENRSTKLLKGRARLQHLRNRDRNDAPTGAGGQG